MMNGKGRMTSVNGVDGVRGLGVWFGGEIRVWVGICVVVDENISRVRV